LENYIEMIGFKYNKQEVITKDSLPE